jgi:Cu+-exporting ATPase
MTPTVKDPVCGMMIDPQTAFATREHEGQTFYFCSRDCADKFDTDPHKYGHPEEHMDHE